MEAEAARVREAYGDFWQHIKFRKGWAKPPFPQERVDPFLREAAGLVVCIRSLLDRRSAAGDVKVRQLSGSASEYLWSLTDFPADVRAFVRQLVHHTFRDRSGYVEELSESEVDALIASPPPYTPPQPVAAPTAQQQVQQPQPQAQQPQTQPQAQPPQPQQQQQPQQPQPQQPVRHTLQQQQQPQPVQQPSTAVAVRLSPRNPFDELEPHEWSRDMARRSVFDEIDSALGPARLAGIPPAYPVAAPQQLPPQQQQAQQQWALQQQQQQQQQLMQQQQQQQLQQQQAIQQQQQWLAAQQMQQQMQQWTPQQIEAYQRQQYALMMQARQARRA